MTSRARQLSLRSSISISAVPEEGVELNVHATDAERRMLQSELAIDEVVSLDAHLSVQRWRRRGIVVTGTIEARIVQTCVVSLEPFTTEIREQLRETFWPEASAADASRAVVVDAADEDAPLPFDGETIEVGEIVRDAFTLAVDPYPRKPGASLEDLEADGVLPDRDEVADPRPSPFATLAGIGTRKDDDD